MSAGSKITASNFAFYASGAFLILFFLLGLFAPWIANDPNPKNPEAWLPLVKFGPESMDIFTSTFLGPPDSQHLMGTDYIGRDVFARLVHAIRNSIFFSMLVVGASLIIGLIFGSWIGYFGGKADLFFSRLMEIIGNFPLFLLQLTILALVGPSYTSLFFVMIFSSWIPYTRYTRAEFFRLRNLEYVQAAKGIGASDMRIIFRHILPNALTPVLTYIPLDLSGTMIGLGGLSFLGFGEPIYVASFGELLAQAKDNFQKAWWLAIFPGGTLFLMTLSLTLFGTAIRDRLDPKK